MTLTVYQLNIFISENRVVHVMIARNTAVNETYEIL